MDSRQLKLIEDTIKVTGINVDGHQAFERVSRIKGVTDVRKLQIELDVNTDIYPMQEGSYYTICMATSVNQDGSDTFDIIKFDNQS